MMIKKNQVIQGNTFHEIAHIPDNFFDVSIVDPDYRILGSEKIYLLAELKRVTVGPVFVFAWLHKQWPDSDQYLLWIKQSSTFKVSKSYFSIAEVIHVYGEARFLEGIHWHSQINVFNDRVDYEGLHPHRKPVSLIERLIRNHVMKGGVVFDPFAGSGSVAEASYRLGMEYYGIEMLAENVKMANERSGYELS